MKKSDHVIIIGNGITGITCALTLRERSDCKITVISDESDYFFSRPGLMYVFLGHMQFRHLEPYERHMWQEKHINLVKKKVTHIEKTRQKIRCSDSSVYDYTRLVLATGSRYNKFGWPGENLPGVQGFYSRGDLELLEENCRNASRAVIVGGGLIGVEVAEMLHSRGIPVDFLVREKNFWDIVLPAEEAKLIGRHIRRHGIALRLETELKEIHANRLGRVSSITLKSGEKIECDLVALTAGVSPNIELAKSSGLQCRRGILVNRRFETSETNIYAAGDCAEFTEPPPGRRAVEQVWYTGKAHGKLLAEILIGEEKIYAPGIWFNSAKFFDLEYQVYGDVPNRLPEGHSSYYWESSDGEKCLRLNWQSASGALTGIHAIGMRLRQSSCIRWIEERTKVSAVIEQLAEGFFDPEFFRNHAWQIAADFRTRIQGELSHV